MFPEMGKTRKEQIWLEGRGGGCSAEIGVSLDISGVMPLDKCQISSRIHSSGVQGRSGEVRNTDLCGSHLYT